MKAYDMNVLELIEYFMEECGMSEDQAETLAAAEMQAANQ